MLNDLFVLNKIKEGNIKVFEGVFKLYYSPLCFYAASITGRADTAEEIVQDLFYVLWKEREKMQIFQSLKNYLYRAVRNRSLQHLEHLEVRGRYRNAILAADANDSQTDNSPEEHIEYKELQELINRTLRKLPERRLRIFRMHRFRGMKYAEIATTLGLSVKTIEAEMSKALQTLRKEIENYTNIA